MNDMQIELEVSANKEIPLEELVDLSNVASINLYFYFYFIVLSINTMSKVLSKPMFISLKQCNGECEVQENYGYLFLTCPNSAHFLISEDSSNS